MGGFHLLSEEWFLLLRPDLCLGNFLKMRPASLPVNSLFKTALTMQKSRSLQLLLLSAGGRTDTHLTL